MKPLDLIPSRWLETVGLTTQANAQRMAESQSARAYEGGYYDGLSGNDEPASGDLKSYGYRTASSRGKRDFTKLTQDKLIEIAWILYQSNPLTKRYLEIVRDHVLGRGVEQAIKDEALRKIVSTFWDRNKLDERLQQFTPQLRLFGEQCFPAFVRKSDGRVTLAYIDPGSIESVVTHPENVLEAYAVILKTDTTGGKRAYRIIRKDEGYVLGKTVITPNYPDKLVTADQARLEPWETVLLGSCGLSEYTGSCFYFSVNNVSNQPRGFSDLLQVSDWMDADDETLFSLADREAMAAYFAWTVKLIGVGDDVVQAKASEIRKRVPKKGQALVHNDKEEWSLTAPDLKQQASILTSEALSDRAWGMLGLPKPWRGIGEDSNRASALVMDGPTHRTLENKQNVVKTMVLTFLYFVRDQAEIAGAWSPKGDDAGKIDLTMPEMAKADTTQVATTLNTVIEAMDKAHTVLGVVTKATAAKVVAKVLSELGIVYDPDEELKAAEEEKAKRDEKDEGATAKAADKFLAQQQKMKAMANGNGNGMGPDEEEAGE